MNLETVNRESCAPSFGPFDREDCMAIYVIAQAGVVELGGGEPVEGGMDQRKASPLFME